MIKRLLIANRGEIACRIIRTAKKLGIKTIALFSTADQYALHATLADEAYWVGEADSVSSYLHQSRILAIAEQAKADGIHPGYGFLSENAAFASLCIQHNLHFIGPSSDVIALMGDKAKAKNYLADHGIPLIPGYNGEDQTPERLFIEAKQIGLPLLIKAACGGGGKGIRIVNRWEDFKDCVILAQQEAKASFGESRVMFEKYIRNPRHIEVQIFSDRYDQHVHLFERDCSIQRRHQKIIEETPAAHLHPELRETLFATAITIAKAIHYEGAGTVEFLIDDNDNYYFMEMNTRLQVEHPITEMVTGIDLVEWQIRIANGEKLPLPQSKIQSTGHAIEVRLCAEDPENEFLPSIGQLKYCCFPKASKHIRVDTGVCEGDTITPYYDPMIAKIIAMGSDRHQAILRMQQALEKSYLVGVKTNLECLQRIQHHPTFLAGTINTNFLTTQELPSLKQPNLELIFAWACCYFYLRQAKTIGLNFMNWRLNHVELVQYHLLFQEHSMICQIRPDKKMLKLSCGSRDFLLTASLEEDKLVIFHTNIRYQLHVFEQISGLTLWYQGQAFFITERSAIQATEKEHHLNHFIHSPMPGTIISMYVQAGDEVLKGQSLLVIEAMKMQHTVKAPRDGKIKSTPYQCGDFVKEQTELMILE